MVSKTAVCLGTEYCICMHAYVAESWSNQERVVDSSNRSDELAGAQFFTIWPFFEESSQLDP